MGMVQEPQRHGGSRDGVYYSRHGELLVPLGRRCYFGIRSRRMVGRHVKAARRRRGAQAGFTAKIDNKNIGYRSNRSADFTSITFSRRPGTADGNEIGKRAGLVRGVEWRSGCRFWSIRWI